VTALSELRGVGPKLEEKLHRLGIRSVEDLLFHLPLRYQDRTRISPIGALRPGVEAQIEGEIDYAEVVFRRRRSLLCHISDGTGSLLLRFFHFSAAQKEQLQRGRRIRCYGEPRRGPSGLEMVHPEYRVLEEHEDAPLDEALYPIYPATEGLHQKSLVRLTDQALKRLADTRDWLPEELLRDEGLPGLSEALSLVHRPGREVPVAALLTGRHPAQQRLAFEELLAHQLSLGQLRQKARAHDAPVLKPHGVQFQAFLKSLPFELTAAQQRVIDEIAADVVQPIPMLRLVQGDVGSGKTVVAAAACLMGIEAGHQVAVMAPTEILAGQHLEKFQEWFEPLGMPVAWLSGGMKAAERRAMQERIASGDARIVVGTHALFQDDVVFDDLALVVIDEQHRFGVHQRMSLRDKGRDASIVPHQLIMTATPIPRTLAMTAYADLDLSVIDELPPGRTPIRTVALANSRRDEVVQHVERACTEGRQAYWVCTLIEESEALQCETAEGTAQALSEALPDIRVGLVHGRMKSVDKEAVMQAFKAGDVQLLVATTVIEVGVDVANASLMIIENAERLGLAQLHQLRGRVGRGSRESSCVLMYQSPLSENGRRRLNALRETTDGFEIARIDLELRGPGEVLGTRQTGMMQFRIADLDRDQALVPRVQQAARTLLTKYPEHVAPLIWRWLGASEEYGRVG
jgi:ATP-dependent DNA helicase RecG